MQAAVIRDLDRLRETVLQLQGKRLATRTRACGKEMGQDRELRGGAAAAAGEARGRGGARSRSVARGRWKRWKQADQVPAACAHRMRRMWCHDPLLPPLNPS